MTAGTLNVFVGVRMNKWVVWCLRSADVLLAPFVFLAGWLLKWVRTAGTSRLPYCRNALVEVGVFPIRDHYYEPQFNFRNLRKPLSRDRTLPGIDWNTGEQLELLASFSHSHELADIRRDRVSPPEFYMNNGAFEAGDAEYWYQLIRAIKPKRIFEVGSGNSTLLAIKAIRLNQISEPSYSCNHVCIEPYENKWLEAINVSVIRRKIEEIDPTFFLELGENDVLFIDSSHIIRPEGDVLFEYLEILPILRKGVIVHVHDIFSPKNYPSQWLIDDVRFWNEQYLLEAFLTQNSFWKVIGALNFLHHNYYDDLKVVAPYLTADREPGSFYIQKVC